MEKTNLNISFDNFNLSFPRVGVVIYEKNSDDSPGYLTDTSDYQGAFQVTTL
jgi:hypothetical protein